MGRWTRNNLLFILVQGISKIFWISCRPSTFTDLFYNLSWICCALLVGWTCICYTQQIVLSGVWCILCSWKHPRYAVINVYLCVCLFNMSVWCVSRTLIIHLQRYTFNMSVSEYRKNVQRIIIPKFLTLRSGCDETTQPPFDLPTPHWSSAWLFKLSEFSCPRNLQ